MVTPYIQQYAWARLVFGSGVVAFTVGEFSQAVKRRPDASGGDVLSEIVFRALFFAGILILPLANVLVPRAALGGFVIFVVGAVVGWLGLLLRWWSFATLGTYFTVVVMTSADQVIVRDGPYRILRHPSYTGLLGALLGCGLMLGNWAGTCVSFVLILTALICRLLREERTLLNTLGEGYQDFARHRARLLPFVW